MKRKILLIALLVFALATVFAACEPIQPQQPQDTPHEHEFESKWTYDEDYHWHAATCEHTDEVDGKAVHSMSVVPTDKTVSECSVCGYRKSVSHTHTYAAEYTANEIGHWLETTCGCEVENFAPHNFVDGICQTCGWWSSASDVLFANLSKSDVWSYAVLLDNVYVSTVNMLDGEAEDVEITVSGELQLSLSADGQLSGCGYFEASEQSYKVVVDEGIVYALGSVGCFRCGLNDLLAQNGIDVQAFIDELNANTQEMREYYEQIKQQITVLPVESILPEELFNSLVKLDEDKSTDGVTAYVFDSALLRQLNQTLAATTVSQYVNAALGEMQGTPLGVLLGDDYSKLPDKVYSLLKRTILQTKNDLIEAGFDWDELFDQIDGIIADYYPEDDVNTIDELLVEMGIDLSELAKPLGISLKNVTVKQLIDGASIFSPESLWNLFQQDVSTQISADDVKTQLTVLCDAYKDATVYDLIAANTPELTADYFEQLAESLIDLLDECITVEFYLTDEGVMQQIDLVVRPTDTVYEQEESEQIKQALSSVNGTVTLKRDYELEQDYSQVITQVNAYYDSLEEANNA